jgi:peroxiredoxin
MSHTVVSAEPAAPGGSVQGRLDALQAQRDATWSPEQLEAHAALRRSLEEEAGRRRLVREGDVVAPFSLPEVDGGSVVLTELLADGPVVLIFFRFEACPACNAAWAGYRESLAPALRELGAHLVAVSPQVPDKLVAIKRRYELDFLIASDAEATLIRQFGIDFAPPEEEREQLRREGKDVGAILGAGHWALPYPTAVVVGQDGIVHFADVHPDWMVRTESQTVIDAVRALASVDAG